MGQQAISRVGDNADGKVDALFYLYFEMKALLANNLTASIAFT